MRFLLCVYKHFDNLIGGVIGVYNPSPSFWFWLAPIYIDGHAMRTGLGL